MQHLPTKIHFFVKFRNWKISYFINNKLIFLKLWVWIFTNLNIVFPVVVLVFDFDEFSEGVLPGHYQTQSHMSQSHSIHLFNPFSIIYFSFICIFFLSFVHLTIHFPNLLGCDCGVYVIDIAQHLCKKYLGLTSAPLTNAVNATTVSEKRRHIKDLILQLRCT
jgi:hypothetical protein